MKYIYIFLAIVTFVSVAALYKEQLNCKLLQLCLVYINYIQIDSKWEVFIVVNVDSWGLMELSGRRRLLGIDGTIQGINKCIST